MKQYIHDYLTIKSVSEHDIKSGTLLLRHRYPSTAPQQILARVNIDHVLETLKPMDVQVGTWLNVMGYITGRKSNPVYDVDVGTTPVYSEVAVQAIVVWNAVSLKLSYYEEALEARKETNTTG